MSRLAQLQALLKEDPQDEFLLFAIAKEYEKMDDLEGAITQYQALKKINPDYIGLYYHLAHCYINVDQTQQALDVFEEGITLAKRTSDFHALSELANAKLNLEMEL